MISKHCPYHHATPGATGRLLSNTVLAGRYQIEGLLAVSRLSALYRARMASGQTVVIKEAGFKEWDDPGCACAILQREATTLRMLSQARVLAPRCLDIFHVGGHTYLVMNYIPGRTLGALVKSGTLSPQERLTLISKTAALVAYIHRVGYVHQDLKPLNVQICPNGMPVLLDFGAAVPIGTITNGISGGMATPGYVSVRQLRGEAVPTNDVFALGAMLEDLLPAPGPTLQRIIWRATEDESYTSVTDFLSDLEQVRRAPHVFTSPIIPEQSDARALVHRSDSGAAAINALLLIVLLFVLSALLLVLASLVSWSLPTPLVLFARPIVPMVIILQLFATL